MPEKSKPKKFSLKMLFNGLEFETETDDLEEAVLSFKPDQLYTEVFVIAKRGEAISERRWKLQEGKNVFRDADVRHIFCNNLLLNY